MEKKEELGRGFWVELLGLYDEYIQLGKTDKRTIELLGKAELLRAGTEIGQELMEAFPHLDFKSIEVLVRQGIRERIVGEIRKNPF
jgi:ribosomal 50S subunit-associated protein YjgA (DUF615 family)